MDDFYFDALQNYLNSSDWRKTIKIFVDANCMYFINVDEYHPQQVVIWRNFQDIVENVIQNTLDTLGGSIDDLEKGFDRFRHRPSRGPRDEVIKDILEQLQTVEDFEAFSFMMNEATTFHMDEIENSSSTNDYDLLMRMGFSVELINKAFDELEEQNMDDMIIYLSAQQDKYDRQNSKVKPASKSERNKSNLTARFASPYEKFVHEAQGQRIIIDASQISAFFTIAEAILAASDNEEWVMAKDSMEQVISWSKQVLQLKEDLYISYEQKRFCKDMNLHHSNGLISWYLELEEERQVMQSMAVTSAASSATKQLLSDEEFSRMAELQKLADLGTKDEQKLHSLITHHENLQRKIQHLYSQCNILLKMNSSMYLNRNLIEEVYLHLKESLNKKTGEIDALEEKSDKMESGTEKVGEDVWEDPQVQELLRHECGSQMMDFLLELHLLEDELSYINTEIQKCLNINGLPDVELNNNVTGFADADEFQADEKVSASSTFSGTALADGDIFIADEKSYNTISPFPDSNESSIKLSFIERNDVKSSYEHDPSAIRSAERHDVSKTPSKIDKSLLYNEEKGDSKGIGPENYFSITPTKVVGSVPNSNLTKRSPLPPIKSKPHFPPPLFDPVSEISTYSSEALLQKYKDEEVRLLNYHLQHKESAANQLQQRLLKKKAAVLIEHEGNFTEDEIIASLLNKKEFQEELQHIEQEFQDNCSQSLTQLREKYVTVLMNSDQSVANGNLKDQVNDLKQLYLQATDNLTKNILLVQKEDSMKKWKERLTQKQRQQTNDHDPMSDDVQLLQAISAMDEKFFHSCLPSNGAINSTDFIPEEKVEQIKSSVLKIFENEKTNTPNHRFGKELGSEGENYDSLVKQMKNLHFEKQNLLVSAMNPFSIEKKYFKFSNLFFYQVNNLQANMLDTRSKLENR